MTLLELGHAVVDALQVGLDLGHLIAQELGHLGGLARAFLHVFPPGNNDASTLATCKTFSGSCAPSYDRVKAMVAGVALPMRGSTTLTLMGSSLMLPRILEMISSVIIRWRSSW